jgi:hypothetical protein
MRDRIEARDGPGGMTEPSSSRGEALVAATGTDRSSVRCPSCDHANAAGSHYCNACGMPVHFEACGRCEAINRRGAASCHKCGCVLPGSAIPASAAAVHAIVAATSQAADELDPSAGPPPDVGRLPPERRNAMRAGLIALCLALVAVPAYIMTGQRTSSDPTVDAIAPRVNATADAQQPAPPTPQAAETIDAAPVAATGPAQPAPASAPQKDATGASSAAAAPPVAKGARPSATKSSATRSKQATSSRKSSTRKPATKSP